jgi:glucose/arabinose dehydrogenase
MFHRPTFRGAPCASTGGRGFALLATALLLGSPAVPASTTPLIPPPSAPVFRLPQVVPRPAGFLPTVPAGFRVELYSGDLQSPRALHVLPGGDVLVAEGRTEGMGELPPEVIQALTAQGVFGPSPDRILRLRGTAGRVTVTTALTGPRQPFGMAVLGDWFYVAGTDRVQRHRINLATGAIAPVGEKIIDLPAAAPNNHWTRNLLVAPDGERLFVTIGAATNVNEQGTDPPERAAIWSIRPDGSDRRLYATGLRNPVGLAIEPSLGKLWATVNERDGLGEDTPPDYLTSVEEGAFYGWPWVYFGTYPDPIQLRRAPAEVAAAARRARVPDLALGGHSVPLGLRFLRGSAFPARYRNGAFIARRGGGSRVRYLGFDVVFVPFANGRPTGAVEPFLTGFVPDLAATRVYGRPVDVAELIDGSLLVSDDAGRAVWRVSWVGDAAR